MSLRTALLLISTVFFAGAGFLAYQSWQALTSGEIFRQTADEAQSHFISTAVLGFISLGLLYWRSKIPKD